MTTSEMQSVLRDVKFQNWEFHLTEESGRMFLHCAFQDKCAKTGVAETQKSRKWRLSSFMSKSELVQTAFKAVLTALEHEAREAFTYREQPIFGPHFDIEALHALCKQGLTDARQHFEHIPL